MPPVDRYVSTAEFYVRYFETDAMRIVNHIWYVAWFEEARLHYFRSRGQDYAEMEKAGYFISVVDVQVRYRAPAHYGELIAARCWVEKVLTRALTFGYEIANAKTGTLLATGETNHICIDAEGKATMIPLSWRSWLEKTPPIERTSAPRIR